MRWVLLAVTAEAAGRGLALFGSIADAANVAACAVIVTGVNEGATCTGGPVGNVGGAVAVLATAVGNVTPIGGCEVEMKGGAVETKGGPVEVSCGPSVLEGAHCQVG